MLAINPNLIIERAPLALAKKPMRATLVKVSARDTIPNATWVTVSGLWQLLAD